ncbi:MAG: hypothetical protein WCW02_02655 [Candidatus Buchananbacteria bacterium]
MRKSCLELTTELEALKELQGQFGQELTKAQSLSPNKPEDLVLVRDIKFNLNQTLQDLQNELWLDTPEFSEENLKVQYDNQIDILLKAHLIHPLSIGELGIQAIDNKEYPIPTLKQISEQLVEQKEFFETKIKQGFTKLIMIPFGLTLDSLTYAYSEALVEHHRQNKLFDVNNKHFPISEIQPNNRDQNYQGKDQLVYFPKKFSKTNHQGKTKLELLPTQAWQVLLVEDLSNLPAEGRSQTLNGRKQLEAKTGKEPDWYLEQLQTNPQYQGEQGLTPESWIAYALTHLQTTNQFIDDIDAELQIYSAASKVPCLLLSSFFVHDKSIPLVFFNRSNFEIRFTTHKGVKDLIWPPGTRSAISVI